MWLNLAAGVLYFPTDHRPADLVDLRLHHLRDALKELRKYRDTLIAADPAGTGGKWWKHAHRPSMVFVAPEYMFLKEGFAAPEKKRDLKQNRHLELAEHRRIVETFKDISKEYGKQLVFVPGSIASRVPVDEYSALGTHEAIKSAKEKIVASGQEIQGRLTGRMTTYLGNPLFGEIAFSPDYKLQVIDALRQAGRRFYLAKNVAYMFHDGRPVAMYHKKADYHEVLPAAWRETVYVPGVKAGRATVGGINFGIEICADHSFGVLKHTPTKTGDLPRIHLICSAAVEVKTENIVLRDGGYLIHASSYSHWTTIQRFVGGRWEHPDSISWREIPIGAGVLYMRVIELDIPGEMKPYIGSGGTRAK